MSTSLVAVKSYDCMSLFKGPYFPRFTATRRNNSFANGHLGTLRGTFDLINARASGDDLPLCAEVQCQ